MTTKTVFITSGATWTPPSDARGVAAKIICFGAGGDGLNPIGCNFGGDGGKSGGIAVKNSFTIPGAGNVNIQIPAGNSASTCWFDATTTVLANSKDSTGTGQVGDLTRHGSGGNGNGNTGGCCNPGFGGGGAGAPSETALGGGGGTTQTGSTSGSGAGENTNGSEYTATAGGTAGAGGGGHGGDSAGSANNAGLYGAGGGGSTLSFTTPGAGAQGLIVVIYTPGFVLTDSATLAGQASMSANSSFWLLGAFAQFASQSNFIAAATHTPLGTAVLAGIANAIANATQLVALAADQAHYRFRTDTGAVDGSPTWAAAQDTPWSTTP